MRSHPYSRCTLGCSFKASSLSESGPSPTLGSGVSEKEIQQMRCGMKGETEVSFSLLHTFVLKFLHITFA